jgi:hypothetical protein
VSTEARPRPLCVPPINPGVAYVEILRWPSEVIEMAAHMASTLKTAAHSGSKLLILDLRTAHSPD